MFVEISVDDSVTLQYGWYVNVTQRLIGRR